MSLIIHLDHLFHRNLSVDLCRRQSCVAEQLLDITKVSPLIEQVRGKGVPQAVRRNVVNIGTQPDVFVDHPSDAAGR